MCVGETSHDPDSVGNKPFETRDLVPYIYYVAHFHCDLRHHSLEKCMSIKNHSYESGYFGIKFTLSPGITKYGPHGCDSPDFFFGPPFIYDIHMAFHAIEPGSIPAATNFSTCAFSDGGSERGAIIFSYAPILFNISFIYSITVRKENKLR